jgi:hypothetical protein
MIRNVRKLFRKAPYNDKFSPIKQRINDEFIAGNAEKALQADPNNPHMIVLDGDKMRSNRACQHLPFMTRLTPQRNKSTYDEMCKFKDEHKLSADIVYGDAMSEMAKFDGKFCFGFIDQNESFITPCNAQDTVAKFFDKASDKSILSLTLSKRRPKILTGKRGRPPAPNYENTTRLAKETLHMIAKQKGKKLQIGRIYWYQRGYQTAHMIYMDAYIGDWENVREELIKG